MWFSPFDIARWPCGLPCFINVRSPLSGTSNPCSCVVFRAKKGRRHGLRDARASTLQSLGGPPEGPEVWAVWSGWEFGASPKSIEGSQETPERTGLSRICQMICIQQSWWCSFPSCLKRKNMEKRFIEAWWSFFRGCRSLAFLILLVPSWPAWRLLYIQHPYRRQRSLLKSVSLERELPATTSRPCWNKNTHAMHPGLMGAPWLDGCTLA